MRFLFGWTAINRVPSATGASAGGAGPIQTEVHGLMRAAQRGTMATQFSDTKHGGSNTPDGVRSTSVARAAIRRLRYTPTERHLTARRLWFAPLELLDRLRGTCDPDLPPRSMRIVGRGDFRETGNTFVRHFAEIGGLRAGDSVLDVGCGVGRMALPLTRFLDDSATYDGLDAVPQAVRWCDEHITRRYPRFRFRHVDVRNSRYRPGGSVEASSVVFPYPADRFDFAISTSVFTHLTPGGVARYLEETSRVLKPGGTLFATFFLTNVDTWRYVESGMGPLRFVKSTDDPLGHTLADRPNDPEYLVAQDEDDVRRLLQRVGLQLREPIRWGSWPGRSDYLDFQDIVIANAIG